MTKGFEDNDIMFFGKHRGSPLGDVPSRYLLWLWDNADYWNKSEKNSEHEYKLHLYIKTALNDLVKETGMIVEHKPKLH